MSDAEPLVPTSEVGSQGSEERQGDVPCGTSSVQISSMEAFFERLLKIPLQSPPAVLQTNVPLISFDPDDPEADIESWCKIANVIIESRKLEGVELLISLTNSLKGRAATCLTKLEIQNLTWKRIKELLLSTFSRPKLAEEYFDDILRFQIGAKESACESAMRLWNFIERLPKTTMPEDVVAGFVTSIPSQRDVLVRRELNSHVITSRVQLCRVLSGITFKRRHEDSVDSDIDSKDSLSVKTVVMILEPLNDPTIKTLRVKSSGAKRSAVFHVEDLDM